MMSSVPATKGQALSGAIGEAASRLATFSPTPRLDAELLLAHALGISREALLLARSDAPVPSSFAAMIDRREKHEPVAYITGTRAFWTIELEVTSAVLVPRPDSEALIEAAVEHFGTQGPSTILDLGIGSGALLLAALDQWPRARGVGIDASPDALAVAVRNAARLGLAPRAEMRLGGWDGTGDAFDLVLCNPPYVASGQQDLPREVRDHEPASALFAGADGLDEYRRIAPLLGRQIAPGGIAAIEIGETQAEAVSVLLAAHGFTPQLRRDLAGRDRCIVVHRTAR